jgi:putative PIN family toxin of toxin-antitoxin system
MKNKPTVVLDTNVFINGLFYPNEYIYCDKIMSYVISQKISLFFGQDTFGELIYLVKHFARYNIDNVDERINLLKNIVELFYYSMSYDTRNIKIPKINDCYDEMFLRCAIRGKVNYLVSDDLKSGLHKVKINKLKIVTSEEFCQLENLEADDIKQEIAVIDAS